MKTEQQKLESEIIAAADGNVTRLKNPTRHELCFQLMGFAVLKAYRRPPFPEAPYTYARLTDGVGWRRSGCCYATETMALLAGLADKRNAHSSFATHAGRMLQLPEAFDPDIEPVCHHCGRKITDGHLLMRIEGKNVCSTCEILARDPRNR
jgi:hypothetical protein